MTSLAKHAVTDSAESCRKDSTTSRLRTCEQLGKAGNVRLQAQQHGARGAAQAPKPCEHLIKYHWDVLLTADPHQRSLEWLVNHDHATCSLQHTMPSA